MHDTAELKRQYEAAKSKQSDAAHKASQAKAAYNDAMCLDKEAELSAAGMPLGSKVIAHFRDKVRGPFVVHSVTMSTWGGGVEINLAKIKKDGTAYKDANRVSFDRLEPAP